MLPSLLVSPLAPGTVIAERFVLERLLGQGGVGEVWGARNVTTRKEVALKFLHAEANREKGRARFLREARATCAIQHPNVVAVHDVITHDDGLVMVLDRLHGESLAARLRRQGALPLDTALEILVQMALALEAVHGSGIIHRDLKPANVFLESRPRALVTTNEEVHVKVLDFGLARFTVSGPDAHALTQTGAMMGTPAYMAPEQAYGEKGLDARVDLWSLGIVAYECLPGVCPTKGANLVQVLQNVTMTPFVPIEERTPGLPSKLVDLVGRLLQRDRNKRPRNAREVRVVLEAQLARFREGDGYATPSDLKIDFGDGRRRRTRIAIGVSAVAGLGLAAALGLHAFGTRGKNKDAASASPIVATSETASATSAPSSPQPTPLPLPGDSLGGGASPPAPAVTSAHTHARPIGSSDDKLRRSMDTRK